jgi:hypothetical protein
VSDLDTIAINDMRHDLCDLSPCTDCLHGAGFDAPADLESRLMEMELAACIVYGGSPSRSVVA